MNNSPIRHCPNDRTPWQVARFPIAAAMVAVLCGCYYCPHNRYAPCRDYQFASQNFGRPYTCHPGGRRDSRYYGGARCDRDGCLPGGGCSDSDSLSYYPQPQPVIETPELEAPVEVPAELPVEAPVEVPSETQQAETSPLTPFIPTENFPPPPTASIEPPTSDSPSSAFRSPEEVITPTPLFEGRVNVDELEPLPAEGLVLPQAPTPSALPTLPLLEEVEEEEPQAEEVEEESTSLFPLSFPPRLFRLRRDAEETVIPVPPVAESATSQGARVIGGHSHTVPLRAATPAQGPGRVTPAAAPSTNEPSVGSSVLRFGHSL